MAPPEGADSTSSNIADGQAFPHPLRCNKTAKLRGAESLFPAEPDSMDGEEHEPAAPKSDVKKPPPKPAIWVDPAYFRFRIHDGGSDPDPKDKHSFLLVPARHATAAHIKQDLSVDRLDKLFRWLWLAGLRKPPSSLNYHVSSGREIVVDERADMHLVWTANPGRLFLKPIPPYLLDDSDAGFWGTPDAYRQCYPEALGLLWSYVSLVQYKSDFAIAKDKGLVPEGLVWERWVLLVERILSNLDANNLHVSPRYRLGELRLSRLNKICWAHGKSRGYRMVYLSYGELITANLMPVTAATVYAALVLTAMQVGLATPELSGDERYLRAARGFSLFSIIAPIGLVLIIFAALLLLFASNTAFALLGRGVRKGANQKGLGAAARTQEEV